MSDVVQTLLASSDPSIRYKTRVHLLGEDPASAAIVALREDIRRSARVRQLLAERRADGTLPHQAYAKWYGAHWVLVALADLDYPPGDDDLLPLREQVYAMLFSESRVQNARRSPGEPACARRSKGTRSTRRSRSDSPTSALATS